MASMGTPLHGKYCGFATGRELNSRAIHPMALLLFAKSPSNEGEIQPYLVVVWWITRQCTELLAMSRNIECVNKSYTFARGVWAAGSARAARCRAFLAFLFSAFSASLVVVLGSCCSGTGTL